MPHSKSMLWRVASLLILSLTAHCTVKSDSHVIVRPTGTNSSVCGDHDNCDTLSNLISNSIEVFKDNMHTNIILEFLQGTHEVANTTVTQFVTRKVNKVSWYGSEAGNTVIICRSQLVFLFTEISSLTIKNLKLSNCGDRLPSDMFFGNNNSYDFDNILRVPAALSLVTVASFYMQSVVVSHSLGYGLLGVNVVGVSIITSSTFLENNRMEHSDHVSRCAGGNVGFYFFKGESSITLSRKAKLSIVNSTLKGGVNRCEQSIRFANEDGFPVMFLNQKFKANGLALVTEQNTYEIQVQVTSTSFSQNTGDVLGIPAILLVNNGKTMDNKFEFSNCSFEREGTLEITSDQKEKMSINWNTFAPFVQLKNSIFTDGSHTAVNIQLSSSPFHTDFQQILIEGCTFTHYKDVDQPIVDITYSPYYRSFGYYFEFAIKKKPFLFTTTIILKENCFSNNFNKKSSVAIKAPSNKLVWQLENEDYSPDINPWIMSKVYVIKCIFGNNTSASSLYIDTAFIILRNSTFRSANGTALHALQSVIQVEGLNLFDGNNGTFGGALRLNKSQLFVTPDSYTEITNNCALYGGGIIAEIGTYISGYDGCTIVQKETGDIIKRLKIVGNNAKFAGDSIFGGVYDNCQLFCEKRNCEFVLRQGIGVKNFISMFRNDSRETNIVIPPIKLCTCENGHKQINQFNKCNKTSINLHAFPGQVITVPLIAIGDSLDVTSRVIVIGTMCKNHSEDVCQYDYKNDIGYGQRLQEVYQQCTNVTYTVNSQSDVAIKVEINKEETPNIMFQGEKIINYHESEGRVLIRVKLTQCPAGFEFQNSNKNGRPAACKCLTYFISRGISCNINNGTVIKPQNKWVFSDANTITNITPSLINRTVVHNSCPYDYCIHGETSVNLSKSDEQCKFNRSGILCGACRKDFSIVLGNSNCRKCSNVYLLLIIPFALTGLALVVLLLKCNLTVSVGHINGIIFYANIVQVNKALLFQNQNVADQLFSTFIAWLNLDLGIETCFFESMDSYAKVWLQFVFPVYLWIIAALIIVAAYYSSRMARWIGSNSVPVLATLFLLSYAKLLRTIIAAVSFTYIEFEDKSFMTVWLFDGNIEYFSPKHVALLVMTLLFVLLYTLPLTLLVLFAPCLQARSHYKAFKWVNRLKPFLDAFQGPYSNKFRFWTGLLLVARLLLLIVYASNFDNDFAINFFATNIVATLLVIVLFRTAVYRHQLANWIERLSLLNMLILCSVNWLANSTGYKNWYLTGEITTYTSVAVMIIAFLGIMLYQMVYKVLNYSMVSLRKQRQHKRVEQSSVQADLNLPSVSAHTFSVVELVKDDILEEPLLNSN